MIKLAITNMGSKWWHCNNRLHRINGPAIIRSNRSYAWYNHGKRHRLDGPAIIHKSDGHVEYWVNGNLITEYEYMFISNTHDKTRNISK